MTLLISQAALVGIINGVYVALPAFAIGILYKHGRYLPIWLSDQGALVTYFVHFFASIGVGMAMGSLLAFLTCFCVSLVLYRLVFTPLIEKQAPLAALLAGIGASQVMQVVMSLYGSGKSQHFELTPRFTDPVLMLSSPVYLVDILALISLILLAFILYFFLKRTHTGRQVRLILSNRSLAHHYGLPVSRLDIVTVAIAVFLVGVGALLKGVRYDLQPQMMFYPGMTALMSCVIAGERKWYVAPAIAIFLEVLTSISGLHAITSPYQRSIPFVAVLMFFLLKARKTGIGE